MPVSLVVQGKNSVSIKHRWTLLLGVLKVYLVPVRERQESSRNWAKNFFSPSRAFI